MSQNLGSEKLSLTEQEQKVIAKEARLNKFIEARKVDVIYEKNREKRIFIVCDALRFLHNLSHIVKEQSNMEEQEINITQEQVSDKIKEFLEKISDMEKQAEEIESYRRSTSLSKIIFEKKVDEFIHKYFREIFSLIDLVYELGKKVEEYDPEQVQGYY